MKLVKKCLKLQIVSSDTIDGSIVLSTLTFGLFSGGELRLLVGVSLAAGARVHTLLMARGGDHQPLLLLLYSPTQNLPSISHVVIYTNRQLCCRCFMNHYWA